MKKRQWQSLAGIMALAIIVILPAASASASPLRAPASTPGVATANGGLACTVPSGYVYDWAGRTLQCPSSLTYRVWVPADGVWSCAGPFVSVPAGFTYDLTLVSNGQCDPANSRLWKYQLRVPVDGLWACMVPAGFTYSQVIASNRCNPSYAYANFYRLRR